MSINLTQTDKDVIEKFYNLRKEIELEIENGKSLMYTLVKFIYPNLDSYQRPKKCTMVGRSLEKLKDNNILIGNSNKIELDMKRVCFHKIKFKGKFKKLICVEINGGWKIENID